jgi:hypothetical protein
MANPSGLAAGCRPGADLGRPKWPLCGDVRSQVRPSSALPIRPQRRQQERWIVSAFTEASH